jgi:hypothetical protein
MRLTRKARKRGGTASQRGISNEQTCILVARDRDKQTIAQVTGLGRIDSEKLQKRIGGHIAANSIMCTDDEPVFHAFCRKSHLEQKVIRAKEGRVIDGVYHIQNVNSLHGRYKSWVNRFNGIATKYTDNYLTWFVFLDETVGLAQNKRRKRLLLQSTQNMMRTTGRLFSKYYDLKLLALCG